MRFSTWYVVRAAVQRDSFHVKCSQPSSLGATLHGSESRSPLDSLLFQQHVRPRRLAADVSLMRLLPGLVPVPVLQCLRAVLPALGATQVLVGRLVLHLQGKSRVRGRLDSRDGSGHIIGRLPGAVLLLLVEGDILPAPVLLPSLGGWTRTISRSSPHWILCPL